MMHLVNVLVETESMEHSVDVEETDFLTCQAEQICLRAPGKGRVVFNGTNKPFAIVSSRATKSYGASRSA